MRGRLLRLLLPGLLALLLVMAAGAGAAPATTPTTPTTPSPAPKPANGKLKLYLPSQYVVNGQIVTVPRRSVEVDGVVHPYVEGQWVTARAYLGSRLISNKRFRVKAARNHSYGRFIFSVASRGVGDVRVEVTHARTAELGGFAARRSYAAVDTNIGFGSTGRFVELVQQRLAALHFYIPQTGVYDEGTGWAMDAYHRLLGWGTYQTMDQATATWLLNGWGDFKVRYPGHGTHAEGNLTHQLLALINGSKVQYIFPISSGKPSTPTVLGSFQVYRRVPGIQPDGMYFSSYFYTGYAIHGYNPAPDYPASHGCMRLPMVDAIFVYNWLNFGDGVDVYY
jgi:hypothetical protein